MRRPYRRYWPWGRQRFWPAADAFRRTYRVWRGSGTWGWQGADWLLLSLTLVVMTSVPPLVGVR